MSPIQNINAEIVRTLIAVKLSVSQWTGNLVDRAKSRKIEADNNAEHGTASVVLHYLPPDARKRLGTAVSQLKDAWNRHTLPWEDGGWRVVPAAQYLKLLDTIAPFKAEFDAAVSAIVDAYPQIEAEARRRLNGMFDASRFPTQEELRGKYGAEQTEKPIPLAGDLRVEGLSVAAMQQVQKSVEQQIHASIQGTVRHIIDCLAELVQDGIGRLSKANQEGTRYGGLAAQARKICGPLRELNITGDAELARLIDDTEKAITFYSGDSLRDSETCRQETKRELTKLSDALARF